MKTKLLTLAAVSALASLAQANDQDIHITEFSYKGLFGEYVEVSNTGSTPVDIQGWYFEDSSQNPKTDGVVMFSSSTVLGQNESVIITEVSEEVFKQAWYEDSGEGEPTDLVAIFENNTVNLGRNDEINIYSDDEDGNGDPILIDRVTYDDEGTGGAAGPRTEDVSAVVPTGNLDAPFSSWTLSADGTGNAWKAGAPGASGPEGSPGVYPN